MTLESIRQLVADDAHALTFQTFGQYRTALLKAIDQAALPTPAPTMVDGEYPPLPDTDYRLYEAGARDGYGDAYDADQMRAYVDADRATRPTLQSLGGDAGVSEEQINAAVDAWFDSGESDPHDFSGRMRAAIAALSLSLTSVEKSDGKGRQVVSAKVHEEDSNRIHASLYAPMLKEFTLEATREDDGRNWYIEVSDEGGYHLYDGYWRDSDRKTCAEVLAEAADGALLHTLESPPAEASPIAFPAAPKAAEKSGRSE